MTQATMNRLWVVEIRDTDMKEWLPTVGAYLTRGDARREMLHDWQHNNPSDKFRIRVYEQKEQP